MAKPGSKYHPLFNYLRERGQDEITLTFSQVEKLLARPLPEGARIERGWWGNRKVGASQAGAWLDAGYKVVGVDMERQRVTFGKPGRIRANYVLRRDGDLVLWDADLIRALRLYMGLSQAEFAEHLGVRQQTVSEWEKSVYAPTRATSKHLSLVAEQAGFKYGD